MEQKPERPRITFCTHHRQGIRLSTDRKPQIDFEKLALRIDFVRVCQRKIRVRMNADFSLYYSLFIIHHSLFTFPTRGFLMKNE